MSGNAPEQAPYGAVRCALQGQNEAVPNCARTAGAPLCARAISARRLQTPAAPARMQTGCPDLATMPRWRDLRGAYGRRRRALRQALLEPLLVGWPTLRDVVMNALAARGHLVLCELGDVRFFVDPSDRVVGAWLMWHGGWQRREIDTAVDVLSAAQRLPANAVFVDVGAHIGTHTIYALRTGRFARAIAFEPEPRNADLLVRNLEANGLSQAAVVVPKAAGAAPGAAVLHLHPRNTGAHAIGEPPSVDGQARLDVPVVRVDDELERLGVPLETVGRAWWRISASRGCAWSSRATAGPTFTRAARPPVPTAFSKRRRCSTRWRRRSPTAPSSWRRRRAPMIRRNP